MLLVAIVAAATILNPQVCLPALGGMKSGPSRDGENEDAEREGCVDDGGEDEGLFCLEKGQ